MTNRIQEFKNSRIQEFKGWSFLTLIGRIWNGGSHNPLGLGFWIPDDKTSSLWDSLHAIPHVMVNHSGLLENHEIK